MIIGIGVLPNVELAEAAGLDEDNGIIIDDHALTSDPERDELIATDCINRPQEFMFSRRVIGDRLPVDRDQLADPDSVLGEMLKAALAGKAGT